MALDRCHGLHPSQFFGVVAGGPEAADGIRVIW